MNFLNNLFLYFKGHRLQAHLSFWIVILLFSISRNDMGSEDWSFSYTTVNAIALLITRIPSAYFLSYVTVSELLYKKKYFLTILCFLIFAYLISVASRVIIIYGAEPFQFEHHIACFECPEQESLMEICTDVNGK